MLGKLLKYEFKATGRVFLPMFGALLIISVINRLFSNLNFKIPSIIGKIISIILIVGIFALTLIITIQRFSKNLLGSEGYLMFTLPVRSDSLIWSKLITATVWNIVSMIVVLTAITIMALSDISIKFIFKSISEVLRFLNIRGGDIPLLGLETVIAIVLSLFAFILMLYACLALSMLVNKRRGLCAFAVFVIINVISQIITSLAATTGVLRGLYEYVAGLPIPRMFHAIFVIVFIIELIECVIFYVLTRFMLTRKLNLE
ncbi:MAG: hypothetical protein GX254_04390 [Clostridiales bacterium]|jgi:hypothetical protein|nr:hypothetical protein [Clostridiales bacterium]